MTKTPRHFHAATLWEGDDDTASADCADCDWEVPARTPYVTAADAFDAHAALKL